MEYKNLTFEDIITAYRKLKSLSYYDTHDLFLREKIASFETDPAFSVSLSYKLLDFEEKLKVFHVMLTTGDEVNKKKYWSNLYDKISFKVLPKKVKSYYDYSPKKTTLLNNLFTNVRELKNSEKYEFDKITFFIDAPIEIHLISVLWTMKVGYHLEDDLFEKCYGNRLILERKKANSEFKTVTDDDGLFKPYYKQYQKWRDEGIEVAKQFLEKKQDVLFINIDIKDYYYSVRLDFGQLNKRLLNHQLEDWSQLNDVFEMIHRKYTSVFKETRYPNDLTQDIGNDENILPIGLASSYILANWYLKEFDASVNQTIRPVYYSRYVDDIFIILANSDLTYITNETCPDSLSFSNQKIEEDYLKKLTDAERYIIKTLYPVITLENIPKELKKRNDIQKKIFKISCYRNLYIQTTKTLVYFFHHESSLALLDKFKEEMEKRSSEFRFLPDKKLEENGFDEEAYELVFDDSAHKIKTLKDYKENRYGISSHLSKKIYYSLRNGDKNKKEDAKKISKFFRGTTNFEHFRQWERLVTYFVVNNNREEFLDFTISTIEQIFKLPIPKNFNKYKIDYLKIAIDLLEYLSIAIEMAFSLDPLFAEGIEDRLKKQLNSFYNEFNHSNDRLLGVFSNWQKFRLSNMLRHNYVNIPLLNYTDISPNASLLEDDLSKLKIKNIEYNPTLVQYSPRKVRFCEVAWMECIKRVLDTPPNASFQGRVNVDNLFDEDDSDTYLDDAFEIYFKINYWYKNDRTFKNALKKEIFKYDEIMTVREETEGVEQWKVVAHEISVNQKSHLDKLRVGLANMKVEESNYECSMLGKPNMKNRYVQFAKILNEAEIEKCDMVVLPELCLPYGLVKTVMENSWNHQRAIVSGIEHWTHNDVSYNFIITLLPCEIRGIKDTVPILRLKNHYAPIEEFWINDYRKVIPKPSPYRYHLLRWKGLYFTNFYCFELADIVHRSIFRSKLDFLIASEWNKDINFYSNITEVTSRDLHCYFIQVNTSHFGDSRVTHPKKTERRDSLRIKGGLNTGLLVDELDIKSLRAFQYKGFGQQKDDREFKTTPADYKHDDALLRQENRTFGKTKK